MAAFRCALNMLAAVTLIELALLPVVGCALVVVWRMAERVRYR